MSITLTGQGGGGALAPVPGKAALHTLGKRPGHVLVTRMTSPTQLKDMLRAAAVVTDEGGEMCHAAVVCRAEGIPYVIGTKTATTQIKDGDELLVDPVNKTVTIVRDEVVADG